MALISGVILWQMNTKLFVIIIFMTLIRIVLVYKHTITKSLPFVKCFSKNILLFWLLAHNFAQRGDFAFCLCRPVEQLFFCFLSAKSKTESKRQLLIEIKTGAGGERVKTVRK